MKSYHDKNKRIKAVENHKKGNFQIAEKLYRKDGIYDIFININLKIFEGKIEKDEKTFVENFEYKNQSNKFNLEKYEKKMQEILINKISKKIISYLYYVK